MAVIAVLVNRTAWGSAEPHTKKAPGAVVTTESATTQPSDRLTFTPVVQRSLPVGPDYRGAISFVTGTAPWWPKAAWIHAPRSEDIERQVGQWLEVHKIDASGDENCGLVGHGLVAAEMKAAFVDVTPEMIVKATHGLDPKSRAFSAGTARSFPARVCLRHARRKLGGTGNPWLQRRPEAGEVPLQAGATG
jgi:hypothetical protein